jgi:hypothetical protein
MGLMYGRVYTVRQAEDYESVPEAVADLHFYPSGGYNNTLMNNLPDWFEHIPDWLEYADCYIELEE